MNLIEVTSSNIKEILSLKVKKEQKSFVASNKESLKDAEKARKNGDEALPFGLYEEGKAVGFVLIGYMDRPACEHEKAYCIWRLMIDQKFQNKGFGKKAMKEIIKYIQTFPCKKARCCWLSYEPDNKAAKHLYHRFGFRETGEMEEGECIAIRELE